MSRRIRGSGRVFQRGARWWIAWYSAGVEHRESGGDTEKQAHALLIDRLASIGRGEPVTPEGGRLTVRDVLTEHLAAMQEARRKSMRETRLHAARVTDALGDLRIARLTPDLVRRRYIAERRAAKAADGTIRTELGILTAALNRLRKEGRLAYVPFIPKPPASPARQGFVEPEAFETIAAKLAAPFDDAVRFLYASAWRSGEVKALAWSQVFRREGEIRLPDTKNGRARTIPLTGELAAIIERRLKARLLACPLVFHREGRALSWRLLHHFKRAAPGLLVHDLRRSGVRNLVRAGVSETVAMTISGHRSRSVFERYNVTSTEDQLDALAATDAYRASRAGR